MKWQKYFVDTLFKRQGMIEAHTLQLLINRTDFANLTYLSNLHDISEVY